MVGIVNANIGVHAFGHELLGDRVDHPVLLGDEEPGWAVFPPGFRHRLLDTLHGDGSLHRRQHRVVFGISLLGECNPKGVDRQPDQP